MFNNDTESDNPNYAEGMPSRGAIYAVAAAGVATGIAIVAGVGWTMRKLEERKNKKTNKN